MSALEATIKEKELGLSIFYFLLFVAVSLIVFENTWHFQQDIAQLLDGKLHQVFVLLIQVGKKIQGKSNLFDSQVLHYFLLVVCVFICLASPNKPNLKATKIKGNLFISFGLVLWGIPLFFTPPLLLSLLIGFSSMILLVRGGLYFNSMVALPENDLFNERNEQFPQNALLLENEFSVGYKTQYLYKNEWQEGIIPIVNPQRGVLVAGSQGSGKTYSVLIPAIWQSIFKGYCGVIYDFKFPDLSLEAFNALHKALQNDKKVFTTIPQKEPIIPKFIVIDFENLKYTNRCNPFHPKYLQSIDDVAQLAKTLLLNINKSWVRKEGDFWILSAINYLICALWFLKLIEEKYSQLSNICDLPHAIELINKNPETVFRIIERYPELDTYSAMFILALRNQAGTQLAGQIATIQAALAGLSSPNIYWVMSGNEVDLSVNDPKEPKIFCLGNTPIKSSVYGAALSVYTATLMKKVYQHKQIKCGFFIDELPSMYLMGLDDFIATVRSYKVATWLGLQDIEQLVKSYGQEAANVIINTCGTIFSGAVNAKTAETFSKMFGKTNQHKVDANLNKEDINLSYVNQMQDLVPASKIITLSQGNFIGKLADTFEQPIDLKLFKAYIHVEKEQMKKKHTELPLQFKGTETELHEAVQANYQKIKSEVQQLIDLELTQIV